MLKQAVFDKFKVLSLEAQELFLKRLEDLQLSPLEIPILTTKVQTKELSYAQERLWFLNQFEPDSSYHLSRCIRLKGSLSKQALANSINVIIQNHKILKTRIFSINGKPCCDINESLGVILEMQSINETIDEDSFLSKLVSEPFSLENGPLFRTQLIATNQENEYLFLLTIHHLISDGLSIDIIFKEIATFYNAFLHNREIATPLEMVSYSDYVFWQRKWSQNQKIENSLQYWKLALKEPPNLSLFPLDFPLQNESLKRGSQFEKIWESLNLKIDIFCKEQKVTLFNFFLTCFNILFYRYTTQEDVIFGTPSSGRLRPELSNMVGLFANTVILRNKLLPSDSFLECLKKISQNSIEAFDHQLVPFERIVQEIDFDRNISHSPLFQIFFIYHKAKQDDLKLENMEWEIIPIQSSSAKFAMTVEIIELDSTFKVNVEYSVGLYKQSTIENILEHFKNVIFSALENPHSKLSELSILSSKERKCFDKWNDTKQDILPTTIHELISTNSVSHIYSTAIEYGRHSCTYEELERRSNSIASFLVNKGLVIGDRVGVYMLPNLEMVPCLLGILKAGCAYVPLDPSHPKKRLEHIVEDAKLKLILIDSLNSSTDLFSKIDQCDIATLSQYHQMAVLPKVQPSEVAYLMYTSGSTGIPKGIMVEHRNVINALTAFKHILDIKSKDRWLSTTTFAFDISVLEFFLPLSVGAILRIVDRGIITNVADLIQEFYQFKPTIVQGTPSFWILMLMKEWQPDVKFKILCGGEQLSNSLARQLKKLGEKVFNVYGPTETTIWSTVHELSDDDDILIGKPIANTQIYILDKFKSQVPINVEGDLYIGGKGVSRGYVNRPELMKNRFTHIPHIRDDEIVYSTNDRAKFTESGAIKFIGRSDNQVKIRGFRVETQEIEVLLQNHETVQRAVVYAKVDSFDQNYLVVFIQPTKSCSIPALQAYLKELVPSYMIPSKWKIIDKIPTLPNGKIDLSVIKAIQFEEKPSDIFEDLTENQEKMANIWEKNLKIERLGRHDNYFDLGGHSLLAVQLIDDINKEFQSAITLKVLFKHPTLAKLTDYLENNPQFQSIHSSKQPFIIDRQNAHLPFPLTDVQRAYWLGKTSMFGSTNLSSHLYREIEIKNLDILKLEKALNYLIKRHDALRTIILNDNQQQVVEQIPWYRIQTYDARQIEQSKGEKIRQGIREEMSHQSLQENQCPLFDIKVTCLANFDCLHISLNLLIADALSLEILLNELGVLYDHPQLTFPPLNITFRDYIEHIVCTKNSSAYNQCKNYWLSKIDNFTAGPQLPIERHLATLKNPKIKRFSRCLNKEDWLKLKAIIKKEGLTPNVALLTAFAIILRKWSLEPNFSIVLTLFNRPPIHKEINSIVGDFTTVSIFDIPFKANSSFIELAIACQERLFEDLDHRHFSGIQVTQELLRKGKITQPIPIVFTSLIGNERSGATSSLTKDTDPTHIFSVTQTPQVILDHQLIEYEGNLYLNWDVVEDVFPENLISVMFDTYFSLLTNLSLSAKNWEMSDLSFSDIIHTTPFNEMLNQRNQKKTWKESQPKLLHEGIIKQAGQKPNAIAITQGEKEISFSDLIRESLRVYHELIRLEIPQHSFIAILMDKSWEQIATALGVLMHGSVYVPIDISQPFDRIEEIIEESGCRIGFVNQSFKALTQIKQINYHELSYFDEELIPSFDIPSNSLAYVIYTSGSSGKPKGVMIEHQAAINTIHAVNKKLGVTENDSIYGISSLSFDLSVYDIFGILSVGGKLVLPEPIAIKNPAHWIHDIERRGITIWNSAPSFMSMFVEYIKDDDRKIEVLKNLKTIMLSGDWIPVNLPPLIEAFHPNIKMLSLGGATEASIWSIWYQIPKNGRFDRSIPYGESMDNQIVLILDSNLKEQPLYAEGEIYIGGAGVARGYWNNQEKTDLQFINHLHFGKLFRTFDKGRYLADGNIEFLGRKDRQVKIKGFRIELSEIEAKINQFPGIQQSSVIVFDKGDQQKELHAFVCVEKDLKYNQEGYSALTLKLKQSHIRKELENNQYEKVSLLDNISLQRMMSERRSHRTFLDHSIPFTDLSLLLYCLKQTQIDDTPLMRACYGSASGLYPIQVYVHIKNNKIEGVSQGNYYYHSINNQLIKLNDQDIPIGCFAPNNQNVAKEAAFYIFLIADLSIIESVYQSQAKLYCSLEAGMISQLLEMQSIETKIGLCQLGNTNFDIISPLFSLPSNTLYIHGLLGGYISQESKDLSLSKTDKVPFISHEEKIMSYLKQKLPHYMLPSSISILPNLPMTNNGKVDQKALNIIIQRKSIKEIPEKISGDGLYSQLITLWQEVLDISEPIHNQTSFFDLGGDSFKLIQLHKKLEKFFEVQIPIGDLFRFSTIEEQFKYLKKPDQTLVLQQSKTRAQLRNQSRKSGLS